MYDEAGHIVGEYTSTGALVQETVWLGDIPVAMLRPGTPAVIWYVHADHLGTPPLVTCRSYNKIAWRWDSDAFDTTAPNQNPQALGTFVYKLRFPGQAFDSGTGLFYNDFREYDPYVGAYVENDEVPGPRAAGPTPTGAPRRRPVARHSIRQRLTKSRAR